MRKTLIIIGIIFAALILIALVAGWSAHEPRPQGAPGPEADALARKMQQAVNIEAWNDTRFLSWSFPGGHDYVWDKQAGLVQVKWGGTEVLLRTDGPSGKAWANQQPLQGGAADEAIQEAWGYFCNDSFWLNAPAKAFDPGTNRKLVTTKEGEKALLISYESGGVTPGDAYLWHLDKDGMPVRYEMWVSIIPIGGLDATWESWANLSTGAKVATVHDLGIYKMGLSNVKGGNTLADIGLEVYPFEALGARLR
ncbi:MAG: hypothetical protein RIC19_12865 [Phaeodactylibacter sp.]|uniref:hypothetical protein n=1 Tax=Phaeodactylibacter sp. TaxID=1940289 RepID=UPI0032EEE036